jgi:hypothetical protein
LKFSRRTASVWVPPTSMPRIIMASNGHDSGIR